MEEKTIMDQLIREANFALASESRDLVYQAYGSAKMAYQLGAITWDEFLQLNTALVVNGLNNLAKSHLH